MQLPENFYLELHSYIEALPYTISQRGKDIVSKNLMDSIVYNPKKSEITTKVYGNEIYDVVISLDADEFTISDTTCSCPYPFRCKHLAAMAFSISDKEQGLITKSSSSSKKKEKVTKLSSRKKKGVVVIHSDSLLKIQQDLNKFKNYPAIRRLPYGIKSEHILEDNGKVKTTVIEDSWNSQHVRIIHEINFSLTQENVEIRCVDCQSQSKKLCAFASYALENLLDITVGGRTNLLDYSSILARSAKNQKISIEQVQDLFSIELTYQGARLMPTHNSLIDSSRMDLLKNFQKQSQTHNENSFLKSLEAKMEFGEAFAWSSALGLKYKNLLFILRGKLNKTGDKLMSKIQDIEEPILLSAGAKNSYNSFISGSRFFNEEYANEVSKIEWNLNFFKSNLEVFKSNLNYIFNPFGQYYSYEFKLRKKDISQFQFSDHYLDIHIDASLQNGLYTIKINYLIDGEIIDVKGQKEVLFNWHFVILNGIAYLYQEPATYKLIIHVEGRQELKFLPNSKKDFFDFVLNLEKDFIVHKDESLNIGNTVLTKLKKQIRLEEKGLHVIFYPEFLKGKQKFKLLDLSPKMMGSNFVELDPKEVETFIYEFNSLHFSFKNDLNNHSFRYLHRNDYIKDEWHLKFFERCEELGIIIVGLDKFEKILFSSYKAEIESNFSSKIDWFELNVVLSFGGEKVERKKWIKAIKAGQSYVELEDGTLGLLPEEWFQRMSKVLSLSEVSKDNIRINKLRFNVIDELVGDIKDPLVLKDVQEKKMLLQSYNSTDKKSLPQSVHAKLRPYQEESYQWLRFLDTCRFGGILADDMGLGKTLQIITLLASAKENDHCHALVIVPRSLIFNWANEIEKFCSDLKYFIHHGNKRHMASNEEIEKANVIISTYGTVVRDIDEFRKKDFTHIILDESQAIKNPTSKRYKSIRLLQSPFKLCATGTPIQNNTFDLYAQMSFVNPGLLGNQTSFRTNFAKPIDKVGDAEAAKLLLKMIHPFLLRRTKEQVAKDLPDKIETTILCEMLPNQRKLYEELKEQIKRDLLSLDDDDSQLKFKVLDGLLRLRQLCNSPLLVDKTLKGEGAKSIKIESLIYKLTEEIGEGSALVFSQFVQMLSLIRKELDAKKIPYAYLDGSSRNREEIVKNFMEDDNCKIFLISLKAGNTGLNLTKAQYVFIVDPWWNPAVEAQAIDRTHRIGQKQKVFAYKMICKNTIEEKIILLQSRKKKVAKNIIQTDESTFKSLNKKELMELFE